MARIGLDTRTGGVALVVGYGVLGVALLWNASDGLATATGSLQGLLFFVVLPLLGLASGVYTYLDWPYRTPTAFVSGSYLAMVGLTLALLVTTDATTTGAGVVIFGLAVLALVASLRSAVAGFVPELTF